MKLLQAIFRALLGPNPGTIAYFLWAEAVSEYSSEEEATARAAFERRQAYMALLDEAINDTAQRGYD
jgi:hypothetical protein